MIPHPHLKIFLRQKCHFTHFYDKDKLLLVQEAQKVFMRKQTHVCSGHSIHQAGALGPQVLSQSLSEVKGQEMDL